MVKIVVTVEDIETIVDWWRGANEAPGGCSDREAINGMREAVMRLEFARREQLYGTIDPNVTERRDLEKRRK